MPNAPATLLILLVLVGACPGGEAAFVWWEGESPVETSFPSTSSFAASTFPQRRAAVLSGGDWLTNEGTRSSGESEPFARWRVTVPAAGDYDLWTRKFWLHGPFRWRFDDGEWRDCGGDVHLADSVEIRQHLCVNWVRLGSVRLAGGERDFEIRLLAGEGAGKAACFDAFVLTREPFTPRGRFKPGEASGLAEDGHWAFEPEADPYGEAVLDLRHLNEREAGASGFVRRDGDRLVRGDGAPLRLWTVQAYDSNCGDRYAIDRTARMLAKRGVNCVRIQTPIDHDVTGVDAAKLDRLHYQIAAMKREGIHTYIGHVWWATAAVRERDGFPGYGDGKAAFGLLFFHPRMQEIYRTWMRALLTTPNPYTGLPIGSDPAVAVVEVQNEDSLLFWTWNESTLSDEVKPLWREGYARFLRERHGGIEQAFAAWGGEPVEGDDVAAGQVAMVNPWFMTSGGGAQSPHMKARASDQLRYLVQVQRGFYDGIVRWMRDDCGARNLIACSNWTTVDNGLLDGLERWTYAAGDLLCRNNYFAPESLQRAAFYAVAKGDVFVDRRGLTLPEELPIQLHAHAGHPHMITETNWERPLTRRAEWPFLSAVYGALQGLDGANFFAGVGWDSTPNVWSIGTPEVLGQFPALALMYRRGDVREAEAVVRERLTLEGQFAFAGSAARAAHNLDAFRTQDVPVGGLLAGVSVPSIDPLAFYVGRVERGFADDVVPQARELSPFIDRDERVIRSITGELTWNYGAGWVTVDTPRAQGACGDLAAAGPIGLGDCAISCDDDYATVIVVSLDDAPLATSRRVLVQMGTRDTFFGYRTEPTEFEKDGVVHRAERIVELGGYPINVRRLHARLSLGGDARTRFTRAVVLDANGYATKRQVPLGGGERLELALPEDALYLVLE
ncbi:MAG TPA: hypothetical protein VEL07_00285 [Planctomycetota bacterium]|nr:hypothetical protein [Planctomycetota bacterium]